ncbi:MAG: pirin family protein, partial [Bacteroidia bacterium]|nr:pirin family protein [Bacteroidia bacterium]
FMMFTSGKGAIHMEETGQKLFDSGGFYHGFQIWLNMPAQYKFVQPAAEVFHEDKMPVAHGPGYSIKVVLGELPGNKSAIQPLFPVFYYHIKMEAGCKLSMPTDPQHNVFLYTIKNNIEVEGRKEIAANHVVLYNRGEAELNIFAANGAELLMMGGKPFNEPVYAYGPFVMNSEDQIRQCYRDYQTGKMGNPELVNGLR